MVLFEPQNDEQIQKQVYHLLHVLPERERQVLNLRYFQGYSMAEIRQELGLHVGHVRVLHLRALRRAALLATKERSLSLMEEATNEPVTTYTQRGQCVLDLAKEEAPSLNQYYIGTEHLLLIEHEASMAEYIRMGLHYEGFRLTATSFGREGLAVAEQSHPAVIVLGLTIPDMSREEIYHRHRTSSLMQGIPLVILTTDKMEQEGGIGIKVDKITRLLKMPFDWNEFLRLIRDSLPPAVLFQQEEERKLLQGSVYVVDVPQD